MKDPTAVFVKHFASQVYQGKLTEKILAQFTELVKRSSNQVLNDAITNRLKSALGKEEENSKQTEGKVTSEPVMANETGVVTTEDELEAYHIVKSILRTKVEAKRIIARDVQSYFGILLDDNNRKPICRLYFNSLSRKQIGIFSEGKTEIKYDLTVLDDIYNYANELELAVGNYVN